MYLEDSFFALMDTAIIINNILYYMKHIFHRYLITVNLNPFCVYLVERLV